MRALLRKCKQKNFDPILTNNFVNLKTEYTKLIQHKKNNYEIEKIDNLFQYLATTKNSSVFRKHINNFKKRKLNADPIPLETWQNYLASLFSEEL